MSVIDSIRRVLAEDAAHPDLTHHVFLRQATVDAIMDSDLQPYIRPNMGEPRRPPSILGVPHSIQDVARDTIVTYRAGRAISSTYL